LAENEKLKDLLAELLYRGGSDLLLVHGTAPAIRKNGVVEKIGEDVLEGEEIEALVESVLSPVADSQYKRGGSQIHPIGLLVCGGFGSTCIANADERRQRFGRCR